MYKNEKVISLLSIEQKINLLTDIEGIDGETRSILGVEKFKIGYCKDYFKKLYPNINSIVNSFDLDLIKEVAGQIADYMKEDGITFAVLPSLKPRISPYRNREFSEDEYLSKVVVLTFVNEFFARNIPCSASGCYLTNSDLNFIDKTPNYRFIYENLLCGYYDLLNSTDMFAVMSDSRTLKGEYKNFNLKLQKLILKDNSFLLSYVIVNDKRITIIL